MRNLTEHPITTDEILTCLETARDAVSYDTTGLVGDMRPTLFQLAWDIVAGHADLARVCPEEKVQRLIVAHSAQCNRALYGECRTRACLVRGNGLVETVEHRADPRLATCTEFETLVILLNLVAHVHGDNVKCDPGGRR